MCKTSIVPRHISDALVERTPHPSAARHLYDWMLARPLDLVRQRVRRTNVPARVRNGLEQIVKSELGGNRLHAAQANQAGSVRMRM
jgi:hypothetical protein